MLFLGSGLPRRTNVGGQKSGAAVLVCPLAAVAETTPFSAHCREPLIEEQDGADDGADDVANRVAGRAPVGSVVVPIGSSKRAIIFLSS